MTIMAMVITWGVVGPTGYSSIQAEPSVPVQPTLRNADANLGEKDTGNKDAKKADKMFPDGPRQTISLDGTFDHRFSAGRATLDHIRILNWSAVRDEAQDFELVS